MNLLKRLFGLEEFFGLDIGYENLKVVQLKKTASLFQLVSLGCSPSPREIFSREHIKDKEALASAIAQAVKEHKIRAKAVVSALPESLVFTKILELPLIEPQALEYTIPNEVAGYIPLEPNQAYLDYQVINQSEKGYEVLTVAAPKTLVDEFIETIRLAGLSLICLETKPLANSRALLPKNSKEPFLIVDLGALATSLTIHDGQAIRFTATLPIGGKLFSERIALAQNISFEEAEKIKKTSGLKDPKIAHTLEHALVPLIDEMAGGLKYFQKHEGQIKLLKILLTGGGAAMPGLDRLIEEKIGLKTERGNPWRMIKNPPPDQKSTLFTASIGLAMRQL